MRRLIGSAIALVLVTSCGGSGAPDPFAALGADPDAVPDYDVEVEDCPQSPERCWIRLEVDEWADGAARAATADYLEREGVPDVAETVVNVAFAAEPWRGCTVFWPADEDRSHC